MEFKFSNESDNSQQKVPDDKKNQSALVLLLLILVGGFTYIYFFTGLIKPQEAQKATEPPAAAPKIVKIPLPPSGGEVTKPSEKAVATNVIPRVVAPTVVASAVPAVKLGATPVAPAVPPKPAPVTAPTVKAVPPPPAPKQKEEIKNSAGVKPAEKTHLPAIAPEKKAVAAAAPKIEVKKPVAADKKGVPVKEALKKPAANGTSKAEVDVSTKPTVEGSWSIVVGNYVLEETLAADLGRVRKSGFEPIVKPGSRKKAAMNRLFVSDFNDRASAQSTLEKLKQLTSDAFVIEQGGKFVVYAGSYLQSGAANSEQERLKTAGFKTSIKHIDIAIPSQSLSVGPFTSKKAADAARGKLKNAGLKTTISHP